MGSRLLTGSWELRLNVGAGGFAKPATGSRIQSVWFLVAGSFEHERSRCAARLHNTIETLPDTNVYHLIKLKIVNMSENDCYFTPRTALCCHSGHAGASCWEISFDSIQRCDQITAVGRIGRQKVAAEVLIDRFTAGSESVVNGILGNANKRGFSDFQRCLACFTVTL